MRRPRTRIVLAALLVGTVLPVGLAPAGQAAPIGQGFNLNRSDLRFILQQIKIAERHAATATPANPCGTLLGSDPDQIPAGGVGVTLPWGLRTVDGSCNNIALASQNEFGAADNPFPRLVATKLRDAESSPPEFGPSVPTTYDSTGTLVFDSQPRVASNLVVDQTAGNPAAVAAAGEGAPVDGTTLFIPNVAPDVGLSAPYNSWFTLFGQFFDHGLDLVNKGGVGTVFVPLKPDDPLYVPGSQTNFMVLSRATHDGDHEANNQTSPFVDQSQTYTSHPSHQVFLREYADNAVGDPVSTGGLITGAGGMATWGDVKTQAAARLGLQLVDADALSVPLLRTDQYGRFLPGTSGYPQIVTGLGVDGFPNTGDDTVVEGDPAANGGRGVLVPADALRTGHAFLDDIAHHAAPGTFDPDGRGGPLGPTPQEPDADPGTGDDGQAGTYDDEMLAAHFIAGDGRVNENIGLTAVHHVFHSEHNRLTGVIKDLITTDDPTMLPEWQLADGSWNGERLFQAARFVTEMEYQHLAFEEFARKVQPMVNLFGEGGTGYHSDLNPAIRAEFAHAVYRFGHSMLNETVARVKASGASDDRRLLDVFLNPPMFMQGYTSPEAAAGSIVRGMTRQIGNELDEFVTEALRNNLLGLPLDLATLNMARARETGVPTLNEARRSFHAKTADSSLAPYESWADMSFSLKHEASLGNFIAAYGTHPTVTAATTLIDKRAAAARLLAGPDGADGFPVDDPETAVDETTDNGPADSYDFLNSVGEWTNAGGVTTTGVDDVDLWLGGLAEKQMVFGGLLGPTFNYVFEKQMEDLQDGDRFYYLSRTAGLNLLTQLEGNSFSELIQRNTDVTSLPADSFSRPDYVFDVAALGTSGAILNDPATEYDESTLLIRMADGTIRYGGPAHVVFNGSPGADAIRSSEGDDTIRGNVGNDRMEGGDGNDNLIGGDGDDIMTDLAGDDTLKGGDGNDAMSSGKGFAGDLNQGGLGNDFIIGGNDTTETFAGPGDDFVYAGDAEDTVFGDDGDDWIEGGLGPFNLLQGDNGAPFQDDPNEPGHDVLFSYGGEQDYDAEGGDDVMLMGPGIQRAEGMLGFDWTSHKNDPAPADSDMFFTGALPPSVDTNRDRWDLVESLSGWQYDDVLRGDDRTAADMDGHALDAAGIARVGGLAALLPEGATGFTGGNMLIGGAGSDLIEGKGGDDLIDGDAWYDVQLQAPDVVNGGTKLVDSVTALQADVFAGKINPGAISIVRTIKTTDPGTAVDVAVFTGPRSDYTITGTGDRLTVTHLDGAAGTNGTDTVRNVETLRFVVAGQPDEDVPTAIIGVNSPATGTVTISDTTPALAQVLTATSAITDADTVGTITYTWERETAPTGSGTWTAVGTGATYAPVAADVGSRLRVVASFVDGAGFSERVVSEPTAAVIDVAGPPTIGTATAGDASATVTWTAPASTGGSPITSYVVRARQGNGVVQVGTVPDPIPDTATSAVVTGLTNGLPYTFEVAAVNAAGTGAFSARSNVVTPVAPVDGTDTAPPAVTTTSPADLATGVARGANITATFNEAVTGVSGTTFTLRAGTAAPVAARVTYTAGSRTATLNPNGSLLRQTTYTATLTSGISDAAGNPLAPVTWTFTTGR